MQHRHAALELGLHFRIAGGREAHSAELFIRLREGAAGQRGSDQTCYYHQRLGCHVDLACRAPRKTIGTRLLMCPMHLHSH